ncbi:MAG TPA: alpha/beta fold hydrolase [Candidatus Binataceae bacterium]|nr:alpha/beta fold hydrolase [Candidatus Binataceae bacterium]
MAELQAGDVKLYYEVHGSGEPLLMIMGLGGSLAAWSPILVAELARHNFRTIIYDNRGTGRSDKPAIKYSLEMFAGDAAALLDALKIERAHIFGVSMGGMIAQELALNYPSRLQTLTLGCTTCGGKHAVPPPPESLKILTAPRDGASPEELIRRAWPLQYPKQFIEHHRAELEAEIPRLLAYPTPPSSYMRHLEATYGLKTYDRLPQIKTPALVVTGEEDVLIPARNSEIIAERIPGAQFHVIPDAGHAFFNQYPDEFIRVFVPFASEHPIN